MYFFKSGSRTCNPSDTVGTVKCSGTLGEPFFLQLTLDTTGKEMTLFKFNNGKHSVFQFKSNVSKVLHPDYINRTKFFTNGTFCLDSAVRTDRGLYLLEVFNSDGKLFKKVNMTLDIQGKFEIFSIARTQFLKPCSIFMIY